MLCQNCGKKDANVRYTQIINGEKTELKLCEECAHKLGIGMVDYKIPSHFSGFLGDFFNDFDSNVFSGFGREFERFNLLNDDLMNSYLLELDEPKFEEKSVADTVLNGLKEKAANDNKEKLKKEEVKNKVSEVINNQKNDNNLNKKNELQTKLEQAIKEERYEDAAVIRDEIKKFK